MYPAYWVRHNIIYVQDVARANNPFHLGTRLRPTLSRVQTEYEYTRQNARHRRVDGGPYYTTNAIRLPGIADRNASRCPCCRSRKCRPPRQQDRRDSRPRLSITSQLPSRPPWRFNNSHRPPLISRRVGRHNNTINTKSRPSPPPPPLSCQFFRVFGSLLWTPSLYVYSTASPRTVVKWSYRH